MIEAPDFLPLGSIVSLEGNPKKLMVIGRGLVVEEEGRREYCDYGFYLYPEGMMGDAVVYGNHDAIQVVHAKGFTDAEDEGACAALVAALADADVPKMQPTPLEAW